MTTKGQTCLPVLAGDMMLLSLIIAARLLWLEYFAVLVQWLHKSFLLPTHASSRVDESCVLFYSWADTNKQQAIALRKIWREVELYRAQNPCFIVLLSPRKRKRNCRSEWCK
ncbi:hypothetical protein QBC35DRAFT_505526 [Podospora australis]|uniref:Uncharacterized protein n=1 Tax=Podospora australis TaxID=1536484 RepID=A0AAN7AEU8_9PEZI|nr:hypothetical protein QBC35DRAFT_505526 [Podospora australis]